jgi:DNA repair exonuclease SbcCD ATPase subunit
MSELRRDREWEHWPQSRRPEERIRRTLRGLFHPTVGDNAIERALSTQSHEIELRAQELAQTVADLERREARTHELRATVEQMLRRGSAELDERHAELSELAARLAERETVVAEAEEAVAERRRELGAVELRRAAVEHREEALGTREEELGEREAVVADLEQRAQDLATRELELTRRGSELELLQTRVAETLSVVEREQQALAQREASAQAEIVDTSPLYVALAPGGRYRLLERDDGPPVIGAVIPIDEGVYRVMRIGASPLPGDRRRCAFLELDASGSDLGETFGSDPVVEAADQ